ncbi:MAG: type II toxin-antitoxin system HicA family toxin [Dehalococcoidia bacterium]|nr:type II toxin-antitoxin system HicA family toxin [Dehalococcoidia bacterium]
MKRGDVIRHIERHGCEFVREGGNHTLYWNPAIRQSTSIPRHQEISNKLVRAICDRLQIPYP